MAEQKLYANVNGNYFFIEEDIMLEMAYIYMYKNNICMYDYLQDDVEICKLFALEEWGVPLDSWQEEPFSGGPPTSQFQ